MFVFQFGFDIIKHQKLLEEQNKTINQLENQINEMHQMFDEEIHKVFKNVEEKDVQSMFEDKDNSEAKFKGTLCKQWHGLQLEIDILMVTRSTCEKVTLRYL